VTGKEDRAKGKRKSVKGKGRGSIMERAEGKKERRVAMCPHDTKSWLYHYNDPPAMIQTIFTV